MKTIDEAKLETDLEYRFHYLCEFIGFTKDDVAAIQASAMYLGPLVPGMVEKTYEKLLAYQATARHFLPRQFGFEGQPPANLEALTASNAQIQFRKEHLMRYLLQLLGRAYDAKMVQYMETVAKMHTPKAGNKEILVPLVQMNALMGWIADILTDTIGQLGLDASTTLKTIRAFQKVLWLQNDFIARNYQTTM